MKMLFGALIGVALMTLACGGSTPPPAAPPAPGPGPGAGPAATSSSTTPALRLGHYSSGDGLVGFVLDRTGAVPKVRIDGTNETLPLVMRRTSTESYDLVNHEKDIGIGIDSSGTVIFSKKGVRPNKEMFRDADAQPL